MSFVPSPKKGERRPTATPSGRSKLKEESAQFLDHVNTEDMLQGAWKKELERCRVAAKASDAQPTDKQNGSTKSDRKGEESMQLVQVMEQHNNSISTYVQTVGNWYHLENIAVKSPFAAVVPCADLSREKAKNTLRGAIEGFGFEQFFIQTVPTSAPLAQIARAFIETPSFISQEERDEEEREEGPFDYVKCPCANGDEAFALMEKFPALSEALRSTNCILINDRKLNSSICMRVFVVAGKCIAAEAVCSDELGVLFNVGEDADAARASGKKEAKPVSNTPADVLADALKKFIEVSLNESVGDNASYECIVLADITSFDPRVLGPNELSPPFWSGPGKQPRHEMPSPFDEGSIRFHLVNMQKAEFVDFTLFNTEELKSIAAYVHQRLNCQRADLPPIVRFMKEEKKEETKSYAQEEKDGSVTPSHESSIRSDKRKSGRSDEGRHGGRKPKDNTSFAEDANRKQSIYHEPENVPAKQRDADLESNTTRSSRLPDRRSVASSEFTDRETVQSSRSSLPARRRSSGAYGNPAVTREFSITYVDSPPASTAYSETGRASRGARSGKDGEAPSKAGGSEVPRSSKHSEAPSEAESSQVPRSSKRSEVPSKAGGSEVPRSSKPSEAPSKTSRRRRDDDVNSNATSNVPHSVHLGAAPAVVIASYHNDEALPIDKEITNTMEEPANSEIASQSGYSYGTPSLQSNRPRDKKNKSPAESSTFSENAYYESHSVRVDEVNSARPSTRGARSERSAGKRDAAKPAVEPADSEITSQGGYSYGFTSQESSQRPRGDNKKSSAQSSRHSEAPSNVPHSVHRGQVASVPLPARDTGSEVPSGVRGIEETMEEPANSEVTSQGGYSYGFTSQESSQRPRGDNKKSPAQSSRHSEAPSNAPRSTYRQEAPSVPLSTHNAGSEAPSRKREVVNTMYEPSNSDVASQSTRRSERSRQSAGKHSRAVPSSKSSSVWSKSETTPSHHVDAASELYQPAPKHTEADEASQGSETRPFLGNDDGVRSPSHDEESEAPATSDALYSCAGPDDESLAQSAVRTDIAPSDAFQSVKEMPTVESAAPAKAPSTASVPRSNKYTGSETSPNKQLSSNSKPSSAAPSSRPASSASGRKDVASTPYHRGKAAVPPYERLERGADMPDHQRPTEETNGTVEPQPSEVNERGSESQRPYEQSDRSSSAYMDEAEDQSDYYEGNEPDEQNAEDYVDEYYEEHVAESDYRDEEEYNEDVNDADVGVNDSASGVSGGDDIQEAKLMAAAAVVVANAALKKVLEVEKRHQNK